MSENKILFVDDEPNVLSAIKRSLRGEFEVMTAEGPMEALRLLGEGVKFSVIVSDCRMPEIDGVELLAKVSKQWPLVTRVMLTGNTDQETAVRAVNSGDIFKFLNKPCDPDQLKRVLKLAIRQYELVTAEKALLEETLKGSIKVLADLLGIVKPEAFGRTSRLRRKVRQISAHVSDIRLWELDAAALLSQLGCVNITQSTLEKLLGGEALSKGEMSEYIAHPLLGADLIGRIPRMERVAKIILFQNKNYDGTGFPIDETKGKDIPIESRILRVALAYDELSSQDWSDAAIIEKLRKTPERFDPEVMAALEKSVDLSTTTNVVRVLPSEIQLGMVLQEDVKNNQGVMLLCRGQEVTTAIREHLLKFERLGTLTTRLLVSVPGDGGTRKAVA
jgi:response regulator RpfG family c-di-GMP phosphodiesterase